MRFAQYFSIFFLVYVCLGDAPSELINGITFTGRVSQWSNEKVDYKFLRGNYYENLTTHLKKNAKIGLGFLSEWHPELIHDVIVKKVNEKTDEATVTVSIEPSPIEVYGELLSKTWAYMAFEMFEKYASNYKFTSKNGDKITATFLQGKDWHKLGLIVNGNLDLKQGSLPADFQVSCNNETLRSEIDKTMQFMFRRVEGFRHLGTASVTCGSCSGTKMKCTADYSNGIPGSDNLAKLTEALKGWKEQEHGNYYFADDFSIDDLEITKEPFKVTIKGNVAQWNGENVAVDKLDKNELKASLLKNIKSALLFITKDAPNMIQSLTVDGCDGKSATVTIEFDTKMVDCDVYGGITNLINALKLFSKYASKFEYQPGKVTVSRNTLGLVVRGPIKYKEGTTAVGNLRQNKKLTTSEMQKAMEMFVRRQDGFQNYGSDGIHKIECFVKSDTDVECWLNWKVEMDQYNMKVFNALKAWDTSVEPTYFLRDVKVATF